MFNFLMVSCREQLREPSMSGGMLHGRRSWGLSQLPSSGISGECQLSHKVEEVIGLADEKSISNERGQGGHGGALGLGGANDRNCRQILAEEDGWLRHNQVRLEILPSKR